MTTPGAHEFRTIVAEAADEAVNLGYRIGDNIHSYRERRAQKTGLEPVIVPSVGYGSRGWVRVLGRALYKTDLFEEFFNSVEKGDPTVEPVRGWRSFTSVAISHAQVEIYIDGQQFTVYADRGGVVDVKLEVALEPGLHRVTMQTPGSQVAETSVYIVPENQTLGIICDVDDTVMNTALPRPFVAAWNSFVLNEHARSATPGMAVMMDRLHRAHPQAPFMYLSTGAWNVTPTLRRFLHRNGYPKGTFLLTDWGPTPDRWFRSGSQHKVNALKRLAAEFPHMRWILIGDDGQRDPEIYNGFAVRYPHNVEAILIRNLTFGESVLSSGRVWGDHRARDIVKGDLWLEGNDGTALTKQLKERGLL
ncbi:App1 family protein [Rothia nasimurium]|uniref:App1 family protein n=1 Tax=Rothia nasimurium TaxID=85336 RepID=UPI003B9F5AD5